MKFVFPVIWCSGFIAATVALFSASGTPPIGGPLQLEPKWLFLGLTVLGSGFLCWFCVGLKRVQRDDETLYVSNYRREIRVPLREVEEIAENRWTSPRRITVTFLAQTRAPGIRRPHPLVAELEAAVRQARGLHSGKPA